MARFIGMLFMIVVFLGLMFLMNYSVFSMFSKNRKLVYLISLGNIFLILLIMVLSFVLGGVVIGFFRQFMNFYLGIIFVFFALSLLFKLANIFLKLDSKYFGISFVVIGIIIVVFSIFNSIGFVNENYVIESDKLDRDYRIVHISDIHIGSNSPNYLKRVVDYINSLDDIDAVLLTGDLIDENVKFEDLEYLNNLDYKLYFVTGNHEHYSQGDDTAQIFSKLNMTILIGASSDLEGLEIIGFDDRTDLNKDFENVSVSEDKFTILMYHQPSQVDIAKNRGVDLMLSGHTHAGQIWPFNYLVRLQFKYVSGFFDLDDFYLNVNPGTGTWGPKMRLGSKNEISVIELKKVKGK